MSKQERSPNSVSSEPLFRWLNGRPENRAKLKSQGGYSDGRITNWKKRGLPKAEVAAVAKVMGTTHDDYMSLAEATDKKPAKPAVVVERIGVSPEALEIARAFDRMQPQTKDRVRELVFIASIIDRSFPWLRTGKPVSENYSAFEKWHQENMAAQLALEADRIRKIRK